MNPSDPATTHRPNRVTLGRVLAAIAVVLVLVWAGRELTPHLPEAEQWIRDQGIWAPVFYIGLVCILALLCFPMDLLFIASGMIFGLWWGTLYLFIATMLSQSLVFLAARHLLRERVNRWVARTPRMMVINRAIERRGATLLFLIRMAPVPASPVSYLMGASAMRFPSFFGASTGLLPVAFASMYFGYVALNTVRTASNPKHNFGQEDIWLFIGLIAAIAGVVFIGHQARHALREAELEIAAEEGARSDSPLS